MPNDPQRILILGGTVEARLLAGSLEGDTRYAPLTSLAGVTAKPARIAGEIRTGGFGGVDGLAEFLRAERIVLMVDATHPFAMQISANAAQAGKLTGVPCLRLERPAWEMQPGDNWVHVKDLNAAANAIPSGARALVTIGRQEMAAFFARTDIHLLARMIEPSDADLPDNAEIILARPPFSLSQETALMQDKRITILVSKNSGGDTTYTKIEAARALGLPVVMIDRPVKPTLTTASRVDEMMALLERTHN